MSERLFMLELKMELRGLREEEREDILSEYETYFQAAKKEGLTEEEIIDRLGGSAKELAQSIVEKLETDVNPAQANVDSGRSVMVAIGLILFNLIIVLGPFLAVMGAGVALLVTLGICFISPVIVIVRFVVEGGHLFELMVSFMLFGGMLLIYPYVLKGVLRVGELIRTYIDWNKRLVRGGVL